MENLKECISHFGFCFLLSKKDMEVVTIFVMKLILVGLLFVDLTIHF